MELTKYHAKYFAYELTKRSSSDNPEKLVSSLLDAQVDLNPHQVDAALFAFKSPLSKGAILADEVGLGKTIEAGLVISQKWAERKRKILIIVPSSLRKQWNQELLDKFFIPSIILETPSFNNEIDKGNLNPFNQDKIVICSFHFARSKDIYIKQTGWDLVVIDEAHHLRNVYKASNKIANAIKNALNDAPKILLTATPLQNSLMELYGLVSIIDNHIFGDIKSFKDQFTRPGGEFYLNDLRGRLKAVCKRTLRRQVLEYIKYTKRIAITQTFIPTPQEQELYILVSNYLQRENLYALPSGQRHLMTLILRKLLASSTFAISGTFEALASKLEGMIANKEEEDNLESSISEDFETFQELQEEWAEEEKNGSAVSETLNVHNEEMIKIKKEIEDLKRFQNLAQSIVKNSKGEVLLTALKKGFDETEKLGGHKKAIIFTESTRTQKYLERILENTEYNGKIVLFNGTNNDKKSRDIYNNWLEKLKGTDRVTGSRAADMRAAIVDYFKNEAIIMIATEAAAEGINLQFCSLVVNYDLPWNPQRIEQRIGRCHRYGQEFDVVVVNFLNEKNAADRRVYQLLDEKFRLFSGVFGASDEILGSVESGVDFEKQIAAIYQNCRTPEEIQESFDKLQNALEERINEQMKDTRQKLLENFDEEVHEKLRINLDESKNYLSKYETWLWNISKFYLKDYARFDNKEKFFMLTQNPFPDEYIHPGPYKLLGENTEGANVYRFGHPLAQRIINQCKSINLDTVEMIFDYSNATKKITILEALVGKSGWLRVINFTIDSFESEDHVLLSGILSDGTEMDIDQCRRLFSLPAKENSLKSIDIPDAAFDGILQRKEEEILQSSAQRNALFFENEMEKLDKWAEDIKNSLELKLKELDKEIRFQKTEVKKILALEEKVKKQREIKELEKKRNVMRRDLFDSQDNVDKEKEILIKNTEDRLRQKSSTEDLFIIKWRMI